MKNKAFILHSAFFILHSTFFMAFIGCEPQSPRSDEPPAVVTLRAAELPDSVEVTVDSASPKGEVWRSIEVQKGDLVALASGSEHRLRVKEAEPARPDSTQSELDYELIHPRKALLTAILRDFKGAPVKHLPVDIDSPTLSDEQINPSHTETDPNGLVFSVIESASGASHTIYIMLNGAPLMFKNIQFSSTTGILVVTSEPSNAVVYLDKEKTSRGATPLTLSLDRQRQYTLRVEHPGRQSATEAIAFVNEQPLVRHYRLTPLETAPPTPSAALGAGPSVALGASIEDEAEESALEWALRSAEAGSVPRATEGSDNKPRQATLFVTSWPANAVVYLNRETESRGATPLALFLEQDQEYTLRIQKPGYQPRTEAVRFTTQAPLIKHYLLEPVRINGTVVYETSGAPVSGAIAAIDELQYSVVSDAAGHFQFDDWESFSPPDTGNKYTLRISDPQARFLPVAREFDLRRLPLGEIRVQRILTVSVFVTDQSSGGALPDAIVTVNAQAAQKGNQEGLFVAKVADTAKPVAIQVRYEGYETPQGKPFYEGSLNPLPNQQDYFLPVAFKPLFFGVELPPDWDIPDKPNIRFVAKRSAQDREEVQGTLFGRRVVFPYAPIFVVGKPVYIEMLQNTMRLRGRGLEVKKYNR